MTQLTAAYARDRNVSKIVVGKPSRTRWQRLVLGSIVDTLVQGSGDIDVYVISGGREDGTPIVDQAGLDIPVMVLDDPSLPKDEPLIARVVASSVDGALAGTNTLSVTLR